MEENQIDILESLQKILHIVIKNFKKLVLVLGTRINPNNKYEAKLQKITP